MTKAKRPTKRPYVSVFTPSHDPKYLAEAYLSLQAQTFEDWEWIILLNGTASESHLWDTNPILSEIDTDKRIILLDADTTTPERNVGALKRECMEYASGHILVELDHDDLLATTCLEKVVQAFEDNPTAALVYSDWAQINPDGSPNDEMWNAAHGWQYRDVTVQTGDKVGLYASPYAMEPLPSNVALIWYAPNHVRAFTRKAYDQIDGYDSTRPVMDDGDIMARLYQVGSFVHIHECLYLQRVGIGNTQKNPELNVKIQQDTLGVYNQQIEGLVTAWCNREDLDLIYIDKPEEVQDQQWVNLFNGREGSSVGLIAALGVLQFLPPEEIGDFLSCCWRVLHHGGILQTVTPSTDGRLAFMNHHYRSYWNENSFWQYVNPQWADTSIKNSSQRWQLTRSFTYAQDKFGELSKLILVRADLAALKYEQDPTAPLVAGINLWKMREVDNGNTTTSR